MALVSQTVEVKTTTVTTIKYEEAVPNKNGEQKSILPRELSAQRNNSSGGIRFYSYDKNSQTWTGAISHYSQAGCLGCKPHYDQDGNLYYVTSSGEVFDENKFALAFNRLPNGSRVRVTNLDNGKSAEAVVNDKGGFESAPYNRIADLTVGLGNHLGTKTDQSRVKIEKL